MKDEPDEKNNKAAQSADRKPGDGEGEGDLSLRKDGEKL